MPHGGNIRALRAQAGTEVTDFSASLNPLGPPLWLRRELARTLSECEHYPDIGCEALLAAAAETFGCPADRILPCNGTSEALFALPRLAAARGARRALIPAPAYIDYKEASTRAGLPVERIPLAASSGFALPPLAALSRLVQPGDLVFLGLPLNPTGTTITPDALRTLAQMCPHAWFIADAAYYDFLHPAGVLAAEIPASADDPRLVATDTFCGASPDIGASRADALAPNGSPDPYRLWAGTLPPNVLVLWSLTKFYGMAGLRLGLALGHGSLFEALRGDLPPWNVNTFAQAAGARALQDASYTRQSRLASAALYGQLFAGLDALHGLRTIPSQANFILCEITSTKTTGTQLAGELLRRGLAVRTCEDFVGLGSRWLRLAVRSFEQNQRLLAALRELLTPAQDSANRAATSHAPSAPAGRHHTPALMLCGTSSNAGKSILTAALCRILLQEGLSVAPFKAQNMSLNSFVTRDGLEMGRAQAVQAQAARLEADVRMNPLLLKPNSDTGSQVILMGKPVGNMRVREYVRYKPQAVAAVRAAYDSLAAEHDVIVLEGAGSPGEVNLKAHDLVNMRMAAYAQAPVLIVGDIDRGGVYASFIGVHETFEPWERELTRGFLVNRFRGDASLLADAHRYVEEFTGRPVLGVVPYIPDLGLPQEDSVSFQESFAARADKWPQTLDVALLALPHLSNFTDFDALAAEPDVRLRIVRDAATLGRPDLLLLPGSKHVPGDLRFLRESGLAAAIIARIAELHTGEAGMIAGICGGLQMLGRNVSDPHLIEGGGTHEGLGALAVKTVMQREKTLLRSDARCLSCGLPVRGYEIHHGESDLGTDGICLRRSDGTAIGCHTLLPDNPAERTAGAGLGRVWGTYLHGIFDDDAFRRRLLDQLRIQRGWKPVGRVVCAYDLEPAFERLAQIVRDSIDLKAILRLLGR